jgi:molybdopterin-guanine dinucleotide biosynthesis protein A
MDFPEDVIGVLLAGGRSSRMGGGDKCLLPLAGQPMLAQIIERLRLQVSNLVINANGDVARFEAFDLPVIGDRLGGHAGPLAGVHAGIEWARAHRPRSRFIVTVATDTPFFPTDLIARFRAAIGDAEPRLLVARSEKGVHPVFGLWPVSLAPVLEESVKTGMRKVQAWVADHDAEQIFFPAIDIGGRRIDPFFNINRPEDLAEAEALLKAAAT